jgi:hypothetical protein
MSRREVASVDQNAMLYFVTKLLRFGKNAPYEGETFPFLPCLNSLKRAGIAPGAAL